MLEVPLPRRTATGPPHLIVDSTGLKLGGAAKWLVENTARPAAGHGAS